MSNMRIGGLASGMDIDSIVKDLMKAERMPLDKLNQKKQTLEWQRDQYRDMNALLLSLREESYNMKLSSAYRTKNVTTSNDKVVTATATSSSGNSSYTISKIEQLATAATKVNADKVSGTTKKINGDASLWKIKGDFNSGDFEWKTGALGKETIKVVEANDFFELKEEGTLKAGSAADMVVKVDGKSYKVVTSGTQNDLAENEVLVNLEAKTLTFKNDVAKDSTITTEYIKESQTDSIEVTQEKMKEFYLKRGSIEVGSLSVKIGSTNYQVVTGVEPTSLTDTQVLLDDLTGKLTFKNEITKDSKIEATYKQNYFSFGFTTFDKDGKDVNENFIIEGQKSLNQVINQVNNSKAGVNMFYDESSDRLTLMRNETGDFTTSGDEIQTKGNFLNKVLRFQKDDGTSVAETGGVDAMFTINGLNTTRHSNTFSINGVSFTLKDTFEGTNGSNVTINVNTNADKVLENIKKFVDKYNEVIGKIGDKLNEKRYRDYNPLSKEEEEAMSEKQVELWEEKAKSGLLRGDSTLSSVLSKMRQDFYQRVDSPDISTKFNQLATIGIKTSANYLDGGKLEIDESKLRAAIEEDPDSIEKLFNANGDTAGEKGIVQRLYNTIDNSINSLYEKAGKSFWTNNQYTIGKNLDRIKSDIDSFEDRLVGIEDRYWRQFTAMEKAIQQSNSQSTYMMQQFSGGQ